MRFRIRTVRRRRYPKRKRRGRGLPYIKNNHIYFGQGVIGKVLGNIVAQVADSILPV